MATITPQALLDDYHYLPQALNTPTELVMFAWELNLDDPITLSDGTEMYRNALPRGWKLVVVHTTNDGRSSRAELRDPNEGTRAYCYITANADGMITSAYTEALPLYTVHPESMPDGRCIYRIYDNSQNRVVQTERTQSRCTRYIERHNKRQLVRYNQRFNSSHLLAGWPPLDHPWWQRLLNAFIRPLRFPI